jgi:hypothetical protein
MNIKIFRANRGEGKTKWLVDKINECTNNGKTVCYVGGQTTFNSVKRVYEATYNELCPLKYDEDVTKTSCNAFFTDELIDNMMTVVKYKSYIIEHGYDWYITMSKEDFVN